MSIYALRYTAFAYVFPQTVAVVYTSEGPLDFEEQVVVSITQPAQVYLTSFLIADPRASSIRADDNGLTGTAPERLCGAVHFVRDFRGDQLNREARLEPRTDGLRLRTAAWINRCRG